MIFKLLNHGSQQKIPFQYSHHLPEYQPTQICTHLCINILTGIKVMYLAVRFHILFSASLPSSPLLFSPPIFPPLFSHLIFFFSSILHLIKNKPTENLKHWYVWSTGLISNPLIDCYLLQIWLLSRHPRTSIIQWLLNYDILPL